MSDRIMRQAQHEIDLVTRQRDEALARADKAEAARGDIENELARQEKDLCHANEQRQKAEAALAEAYWALVNITDGMNVHDLHGHTGASEADCQRMWNARAAAVKALAQGKEARRDTRES